MESETKTKKQRKKETELYYRLEALTGNLRDALDQSRLEPGLSLADISNTIKKVFDKAEIKALIKELQKHDRQ